VGPGYGGKSWDDTMTNVLCKMSMAKMYAFISAFPVPAQCWPGFKDPQNLSNTVWAPGKLDYHDDAMVDVLCKMSLSKLDALNYQNLLVICDFHFKTGRIQKLAKFTTSYSRTICKSSKYLAGLGGKMKNLAAFGFQRTQTMLARF
jgi:hypothetical protein